MWQDSREPLQHHQQTTVPAVPSDANCSELKNSEFTRMWPNSSLQWACCCAECGWGCYTSLVTPPWGPTPVYEPESGSVSSSSFCQTCCQVLVMWGYILECLQRIYKPAFYICWIAKAAFFWNHKAFACGEENTLKRKKKTRRIFQYWFRMPASLSFPRQYISCYRCLTFKLH